LKYKIGLGLLLVVGLAVYFFATQGQSAANTSLSQAQTQLINIGDKCLDFGEKAVAKNVPIIEFQMLERNSIQANVIATCMADNGYKQNPAWLQYAKPVASAEAKKTNVSFDEAITNLGRADMRVFKSINSRPDYWIKK
jgi:hypothetical protein